MAVSILLWLCLLQFSLSSAQFFPGMMTPYRFPSTPVYNPWLFNPASTPAAAPEATAAPVEEITAPPAAAPTEPPAQLLVNNVENPPVDPQTAPNPLVGQQVPGGVPDDLLLSGKEDLSKIRELLSSLPNDRLADNPAPVPQVPLVAEANVLLAAPVDKAWANKSEPVAKNKREERNDWYTELVYTQRKYLLSSWTPTEQSCVTSVLWNYTFNPATNSTLLPTGSYEGCQEIGETGRYVSATVSKCGFQDPGAVAFPSPGATMDAIEAAVPGYWDFCLELGVDKSQGVKELTNFCEFQDALQKSSRTSKGSWHNLPTAVLFYETGCNHTAPMMEAFSKAYYQTGEAVFAKVDIEKVPKLGALGSIDSTPTIKFFGGGLAFTETFEYDSDPDQEHFLTWINKLIRDGLKKPDREAEILPTSVWKRKAMKHRCFTGKRCADMMYGKGSRGETLAQWLEHAEADCTPPPVPPPAPTPEPPAEKPMFNVLPTAHRYQFYEKSLSDANINKPVMDYVHTTTTVEEDLETPPKPKGCNGKDNDDC